MLGFSNSLILSSDSYKYSHHNQYPSGTEEVYSYLESRGGRFGRTLFFGLQYYLKEMENSFIFEEDVLEASRLIDAHMGPGIFNIDGWKRVVELGYLPIEIKAVPEGTWVPAGNVLFTIKNTDPECYWLTNFIETLLMKVWYPTTVATLSGYCKHYITKSLERTGDPSLIDFKLHDFGCRGSTSDESAGIGGLAHLVNFLGTDTVPALSCGAHYYNEKCAGFSIMASEHSTMTSWGRENEAEAYENMLDKKPSGLVACVSDSYNIFNAISEIWGKQLKDKVMSRDGTLIIRPDGGTPEKVVPECLRLMDEAFGSTVNEKGFKVLDPHVRLIQGDGIDIDSLDRILKAIEKAGYSADNVAFGMGAGLLQKVDRDTCEFALKCSSVTVNGVEREVYKDPITSSSKKSKRGKLSLVKRKGEYQTLKAPQKDDLLETVFKDGELSTEYDFKDIRQRAKETWNDLAFGK